MNKTIAEILRKCVLHNFYKKTSRGMAPRILNHDTVMSGQLQATAAFPQYHSIGRWGPKPGRKRWRHENWNNGNKHKIMMIIIIIVIIIMQKYKVLKEITETVWFSTIVKLRAEPCYIRLTTILLTSAAGAGTSWSARFISLAGHHTHHTSHGQTCHSCSLPGSHSTVQLVCVYKRN